MRAQWGEYKFLIAISAAALYNIPCKYPEIPGVKSMDGERLGRYTLRQEPGVFPLGRDSLLLGAFATVRSGWSVCDLGCGGGVLLLLLAQRAEALRLQGVELNPRAAELARRNLAENGLEGQILTGDLTAPEGLSPGQYDLIICNPPYFALGTGDSGGPARCEERLDLPRLCAAAGRLVRNGGRFALCYRPERLPELTQRLREAQLAPKRLQFAHHSPDRRPYTLLLECVKQGRPGLEVLPPLFTGTARQEE